MKQQESPQGETVIAMGAKAPRKFKHIEIFKHFQTFVEPPKGDTFILNLFWLLGKF